MKKIILTLLIIWSTTQICAQISHKIDGEKFEAFSNITPCTNSQLESLDCSWNVFESAITDDGWGLRICYTNNCNFVIKVKITYKEAYKARYCDDSWSYKTDTEYINLQPNRSNYKIIGSPGTSYDNCTRRYTLISANEID